MEPIYILQSTYEKLYALSSPIAEFLESMLPCISANWKRDCVDEILKRETDWGEEFINDRIFDELDISYLLKILLSEKNWIPLHEMFPENNFFVEENYRLLRSVKKIRNSVAHPKLRSYTEKDYNRWNSILEQAAKLFGKELGQLVADLHKSEKEKLFNFISERTFDITMNSPHFKELPQSKQESIKRTKQRLKDQTTAAGIMALFEDSYFLKKGQPIKEGLEEYKLPTFEDVMDEVKDFYYFGKWTPVKWPKN